MSSGLRSDVRMSRKSRLASRSLRKLRVISVSDRVTSCIASGWNSRPCISANQNSRIRLTGSRSKHAVIGDVDAVIVDNEIAGAGKFALAPRKAVRKRRLKPGTCLCLLLFERRAEDAGQIADILGDRK